MKSEGGSNFESHVKVVARLASRACSQACEIRSVKERGNCFLSQFLPPRTKNDIRDVCSSDDFLTL